AALHVPDSESDQVVPMQHGIDGRCEQSQFSDPCGAAIIKKAANSLHLSWRQAISFANYKPFVPDLAFNCSSFLWRHQFSFPVQPLPSRPGNLLGQNSTASDSVRGP